MAVLSWCRGSPGASRCLRAGAVVLAFWLAGCSASSPVPVAGTVPPPASPSVSAPATPAASTHNRSHIRGQIISENGSRWTVRDDDTRIDTVTITRRTDFGTLFNLRARDQFKVGNFVRIAGVFVGAAGTANAVDFTKPEPAEPPPAR